MHGLHSDVGSVGWGEGECTACMVCTVMYRQLWMQWRGGHSMHGLLESRFSWYTYQVFGMSRLVNDGIQSGGLCGGLYLILYSKWVMFHAIHPQGTLSQ
jgi:hypothetical protein